MPISCTHLNHHTAHKRYPTPHSVQPLRVVQDKAHPKFASFLCKYLMNEPLKRTTIVQSVCIARNEYTRMVQRNTRKLIASFCHLYCISCYRKLQPIFYSIIPKLYLPSILKMPLICPQDVFEANASEQYKDGLSHLFAL